MASGKDRGVCLSFTWPYAIKINLRMVPKLVAYKTKPQKTVKLLHSVTFTKFQPNSKHKLKKRKKKSKFCQHSFPALFSENFKADLSPPFEVPQHTEDLLENDLPCILTSRASCWICQVLHYGAAYITPVQCGNGLYIIKWQLLYDCPSVAGSMPALMFGIYLPDVIGESRCLWREGNVFLIFSWRFSPTNSLKGRRFEPTALEKETDWWMMFGTGRVMDSMGRGAIGQRHVVQWCRQLHNVSLVGTASVQQSQRRQVGSKPPHIWW